MKPEKIIALSCRLLRSIFSGCCYLFFLGEISQVFLEFSDYDELENIYRYFRFSYIKTIENSPQYTSQYQTISAETSIGAKN